MRKSWLLWMGLAAFATLGAACSGCLLILNFGTELISQDIENQLKETPEVREYFGEVEIFKVDWSRSILPDSEDFEASEDSTMVYAVKGSTGEGFVSVTYQLDEESNAVIKKAEIQKSGDAIQIQTGPR